VSLETDTGSLARNTVCEPLVYLTGEHIAPRFHKQQRVRRSKKGVAVVVI